MSKFGRTFTLTVAGRSGTVYKYTLPLTVIFQTMQIGGGAGVNTGHFMLYNLAPTSRSDIEYDIAVDVDADNAGLLRPFTFAAGYESEGIEPMIFSGTVKKAFSYREGPDVITDITVVDGLDAISKAQIQLSLSSGWSREAAAQQLVAALNPYGVSLGAIGSLFEDMPPTTRGVTFLGSAWDAIKSLAVNSGGYAKINLGKVYLMAPNDALSAPSMIPKLDASTGLLDTPRRSNWTVDAMMIFEPRLQLLQRLAIASSINPLINGTYTLMSIGHSGIISGARNGKLITALNMSIAPPGTPQNLVAPS